MSTITSVQGNESRLSQLFFEKNFPEPKEEFLLSNKKTDGTEEGEAASAADQQATQTGSVPSQKHFQVLLQQMMASSSEKNTADSDNTANQTTRNDPSASGKPPAYRITPELLLGLQTPPQHSDQDMPF